MNYRIESQVLACIAALVAGMLVLALSLASCGRGGSGSTCPRLAGTGASSTPGACPPTDPRR